MTWLKKIGKPIADRLLKYAEKLPEKYRNRFYDLLSDNYKSIKTKANVDKFIKGFLQREHMDVDIINGKDAQLNNLYNEGNLSETEYWRRWNNIQDEADRLGYQRGGELPNRYKNGGTIDRIRAAMFYKREGNK